MGMPAARRGDHHTCPVDGPDRAHEGGPILDGSPDVFIGGVSAARVGDRLRCNGDLDAVASGEPTVLVNGKPAARVGDKTAHGGEVAVGCRSVLVGTTSFGRCAVHAAAAGSPFLFFKP